MELKPKSVKLVNFQEELLGSGRKLLHCIFENKYGQSFKYKWTVPWRDRGAEYGMERLFFKCIEVEEWNDFDGVWSEELKKVSKEVPCLEEMVLPVRIEIGEVTESLVGIEEGLVESVVVEVNILSGEESVMRTIENGEEYIKIGSVNMYWDFLKSALDDVKGVDSVSKGIRQVLFGYPDGRGGYVDVSGVSFGVGILRMVGKNEWKVISREIASCIRRFIRTRLSEYRAIKRGFEEG